MRPLKIRFEGTPVCSDAPTGIGVLQRELCKAMAEANPQDSYEYTYFSGMRARAHKREIMARYERENVKIKAFPFMMTGLYRLIQGVIPIPYRFFFRGKPDITHFFNFLIPPGVKGKRVVTVHDLAFVRYPETVALRTRKMLEMRLGKTVKRADHIFVDSAFTGRELAEIYGVPDSKMTVVYCGYDKSVYKPRSETECLPITDKLSLKYKNYFFYLGTIEPRKNIERMVIAYAQTVKRLQAEGREAIPFVLGGKLGWYYDQIFERIKSEGIEDKIILAGYVTDEEKVMLYAGARAFVFPSLYEGFGIPALEAMACGSPVLTANASSLPEVVGESALLCDPLNTDEIADGLYRLATDNGLCERLTEDGIKQAERFSWEKSAEIMRQVYEMTVEGDKK